MLVAHEVGQGELSQTTEIKRLVKLKQLLGLATVETQKVISLLHSQHEGIDDKLFQ